MGYQNIYKQNQIPSLPALHTGTNIPTLKFNGNYETAIKPRKTLKDYHHEERKLRVLRNFVVGQSLFNSIKRLADWALISAWQRLLLVFVGQPIFAG
jgi:hypothetical protein